MNILRAPFTEVYYTWLTLLVGIIEDVFKTQSIGCISEFIIVFWFYILNIITCSIIH